MRAGVADNKWSVETTTWPAVRWPRIGDERLARLAARGNARAFAAVYERYHQVLYRYCRSILRDDADAQDALQSTFTRALSALQRGQRSAPLRPWLFRIAHNEAISVLRRRGRGEQAVADASLPVAASAEEQAGERARMAVLLGDLAALPERARSALVMRELNGLSHEEIAIALDTTPGAAKQAIFEARRGLVECAEGRAMPCAEVCRAISDGDRRILRGRRVRAHLRDCGSCAAFAASIGARQADLRAFVPVLPAAASAAVLSRAMPSAVGQFGAGGGGVAAATGAAGKTIGVAFTSKGFATASLLATAAVSVGGVAAVVRLAPEAGRLGKARAGHAARVGAARAHARSVPRAGSYSGAVSRASGSEVGSVRRGTHTAAAGRHVRFSPWRSHNRATGWRQAMSGSHGQFARGWHGRGDAGWQQPAPVARHGTFEGYAGGRGQHGALGGHAVGRGHQESFGSDASVRAHPADPGHGPAPDGDHRGHHK